LDRQITETDLEDDEGYQIAAPDGQFDNGSGTFANNRETET
jgi:hypothetical protein